MILYTESGNQQAASAPSESPRLRRGELLRPGVHEVVAVLASIAVQPLASERTSPSSRPFWLSSYRASLALQTQFMSPDTRRVPAFIPNDQRHCHHTDAGALLEYDPERLCWDSPEVKIQEGA
jgi:hypothetical protein